MDGFNSYQHETLLFTDAPIPMAYVSKDGNFIEVNDAWSSFLGYSQAEMKSIKFQDITHPGDIAFDLEMIERLLKKPKVYRKYSMIKRYIDKQGKSHWVELFASSFMDNPEKVDYFIIHVIPLPNNGKFKVEHTEEGLHLRPVVTLPHLIKDNWQWFAGLLIPMLGGLIYFSFKFTVIMSKILAQLKIPW